MPRALARRVLRVVSWDCSQLSWEFPSKLSGCSAKKKDLWKREEHKCLTPALLLGCLHREIYCLLVPAPAIVCAFHIKYPWKKKRQKDFVASNFKYFCIYLHYWCFGLQTLKSSPRQYEFCTKLLLSLWINSITCSKIWAWVYGERFLIAWQPANSPFSSNFQGMRKWGLSWQRWHFRRRKCEAAVSC